MEELTQETVRETARAAAREMVTELEEQKKQRRKKKAKKRVRRLVRSLLGLAVLLGLGWLIYTHRRVIAARLLGLESPEPPAWHFWCRK